MLKNSKTLLWFVFAYLLTASEASADYTLMQWGVNKSVTPYSFGANINGTFSALGTVSSIGAWRLAPTAINVTNTIVSTPTFADTNEGLRVLTVRSGDASEFTSRAVDIIDYDTVKNTNALGQGASDTLFVSHSFSGTSNPANIRRGIVSTLQNTSATTSTGTGWYQAMEALITANYNNGGTGVTASGVFQGFGAIAEAKNGATFLNAVNAGEFDVGLDTGSSSELKTGVNIVSGDGTPAGADKIHGSLVDVGLNITAATVNDVGFNFGIAFGQYQAGWPITSTGTIIGTGSPLNAKTAAYGVDFSAVTFSTCAFKSTGFCIGPSGNASTLGTLATGAYTGAYSSGTVVDYASGNGRISVGTSDTLTFYVGGIANTQTAQISATGVFKPAGGYSVANLAVSPTAPTIGSGFGTSPSIVASNGTAAFQVNVGTGGTASTGVITMPAATNGWSCSAADVTTPASNLTRLTGSTATSVTVTNYNAVGTATAWPASDRINMMCMAF